ncbi:MAG: putative DNA binding domain-containing protein [Bacteroidaceae bacterium]|nr:putative DNA binding domain-containing protein [Bacteroidaceae bacterium]
MIEEELQQLIEKIRLRGCEWQTTEVKSAHQGCPEKLYDTLSAFSNQDEGGVILFGLDENKKFAKVGVYDAQLLQKKVMEYCEQMTPVVRPVFTVCDEDEKVFVSAEIPPVDLAERPCFKTAKGRLRGAYVRVGDADKPMTEYEVYSYEAFRKKFRDDIRVADGVTLQSLDKNQLDIYMARMRSERPNLARISEEQQYELNGIVRADGVTMSALLLFGLFPQAFYPRLCISASCVPGKEKGEVDGQGNRFTDTKRIEGTIPEMLDRALDFVRNNMRTATKIDPTSGKRIDEAQYPMDAVREAVLNALVHRDYSIYTETRPIQLDMYEDRLEIINPGGLYGRISLDQLGHTQPDTRNPVLVTAMETLGKTENRYSGIPTIRHTMALHSLPAPVFENTTSEFKVVLYHTPVTSATDGETCVDDKSLLEFCRTPRSRAEIIAYLNIGSGQYALRRYLEPLLLSGAIRMTIPQKPRSRNQKFITSGM